MTWQPSRSAVALTPDVGSGLGRIAGTQLLVIVMSLLGLLGEGCGGSSTSQANVYDAQPSTDVSTADIDGRMSATATEDGDTRIRVALSLRDETTALYMSSGDSLVASIDGGQEVTLVVDEGWFPLQYAGEVAGNAAGSRVTVEIRRERHANATAVAALPADFSIDEPQGDETTLVEDKLAVSWSGLTSDKMRCAFQLQCPRKEGEASGPIFYSVSVDESTGTALIDFSEFQLPCPAEMTLERSIDGESLGEWDLNVSGVRERTAEFTLR